MYRSGDQAERRLGGIKLASATVCEHAMAAPSGMDHVEGIWERFARCNIHQISALEAEVGDSWAEVWVQQYRDGFVPSGT